MDKALLLCEVGYAISLFKDWVMTKESANELAFYNELLSDIKQRIQQGQTRAALSANAEIGDVLGHWPYASSAPTGRGLGDRRDSTIG